MQAELKAKSILGQVENSVKTNLNDIIVSRAHDPAGTSGSVFWGYHSKLDFESLDSSNQGGAREMCNISGEFVFQMAYDVKNSDYMRLNLRNAIVDGIFEQSGSEVLVDGIENIECFYDLFSESEKYREVCRINIILDLGTEAL